MRASIATAALFTLALITAGCGNGSGSSTNINGNWSATLNTSPSGPTVYSFTTSFSETSGGGVSITNFKFTSSGSCFAGPTTETGSFSLSGNFSGSVQGTFGMTITSQDGGGPDVLTLQGGVSGNNTITGTWSATGTTACSGSGTFTINRM